jgi:anaerobic selenocysteine-containing dehydrogenase
MHNHHRLMKGKPRCQLLMNTADAKREGWQAGMLIKIQSRIGSIEAELACTDDVMQGVVSLPHGYGHGQPGTRAETASQHAGVSCNDITDDQFIDQLSGNAALNGLAVQLSVGATA